MDYQEDNDMQLSALAGTSFDADETHRRVSEYRRRYRLGRLGELADRHHTAAQAHAVRAVAEAGRALHDAYTTGCVLLALQSKAPHGTFLGVDERGREIIAGTRITVSTAYRYMDLARGWHLLRTAVDVSSISSALRHIQSERQLADMRRLEADDVPAAAEADDDIEPAEPARRNGRPRSTVADRLRRRVTALVVDTRQAMHEDPHGLLLAVVNGIRELEDLRDELQEYAEEA